MFEDNNAKNSKISDSKQTCVCNDDQGLYVPARQTSWLVAGTLLLGFCLFMAGYFWGQKNAVVAFGSKIDQESFGDQIYSSMCAMCEGGEVENGGEEENGQEDERVMPAIIAEQTKPHNENNVSASIKPTELNQSTTLAQAPQFPGPFVSDQLADDEPQAEYFAQLVGFGSERTAREFAQRLSRKEIPVIVKKRQSRSARGRFISWYQVVTEKYENRSELEAIVDKIKNDEKLNDVRIITC